MMSDFPGRTTVVVGASRGLGRGIARAFADAGAPVAVKPQLAVGQEGPSALPGTGPRYCDLGMSPQIAGSAAPQLADCPGRPRTPSRRHVGTSGAGWRRDISREGCLYVRVAAALAALG